MNIESLPSSAVELSASRKGSPFAPGTAKPSEAFAHAFQRLALPQESIGEGVWRETAASATFASVMLVGFSLLATFYFPAGGLAIGILGLSMAMLGLSSRYKRLSLGCLIAHCILLSICYAAIL
jgi:hypothetical protein